jgi:hypothetical protein
MGSPNRSKAQAKKKNRAPRATRHEANKQPNIDAFPRKDRHNHEGRTACLLEGDLPMLSFAVQAASRCGFLQFLTGSPLWAAGAREAFADQGFILVSSSRFVDVGAHGRGRARQVA